MKRDSVIKKCHYCGKPATKNGYIRFGGERMKQRGYLTWYQHPVCQECYDKHTAILLAAADDDDEEGDDD